MAPDSPTRRSLLRACSSGVGVAIAGCAGGSAPRRRVVEMTDDLRFEPETVTIAAGGTIVWENVGTVRHTVTAYGDRIPVGAAYFASGGFDSERAARRNASAGLILGGETFEIPLATAGRYDYFCIPHESSGMTGTVRVR